MSEDGVPCLLLFGKAHHCTILRRFQPCPWSRGKPHDIVDIGNNQVEDNREGRTERRNEVMAKNDKYTKENL